MQENNSDIPSPIEPDSNTPAFKKKKFNGHLRNKHKKAKSFKSPEHLPADEIEAETVQSPPKPEYSELFYLLRQKFAYNKVAFFEKLTSILNTHNFNDIKEGNMSLFSYSCVYEKNEIFVELSNRFSKQINKEDFETYIVPICLNKNDEILKNALEVFTQHIKIEEPFVLNLVSRMAKMSYRDLNNSLVLKWLNDSLTPEIKEAFWREAINEKNISLINTALAHKDLKSYLKENIGTFTESLEKIGKKAEILKKLDEIQIANTEVTLVKPLVISEQPKLYLSDASEQLDNLRKEEINTKVVVRKRKTIA